MTVDEHIERLAPDVEQVLATALDHMGTEARWSAFEVGRSLNDLLALGRGEDACYDSPGVGWAYAGWYHGRRVQDAVRMLVDALLSQAHPVTLIDLGSGTGATLWALATVRTAALRAGVTLPPISVVAVDASAPMLQTSKALWAAIGSHPTFQAAAATTPVDWRLATWTDLDPAELGDAERWVVAGHLFDSSDSERLSDVCRSVAVTLDVLGATRLFTSTAWSKRNLAGAAAQQLAAAGWGARQIQTKTWWDGGLHQVGRVRRRHYDGAGIAPWLIDRDPPWADGYYGLRLERHTPSSTLFDLDVGLPFRLDEVQRVAAEPDERLTAILGAAGSGKSWVLVERIVRTAERPSPAGRPHHILVTTFNRRMVTQLSDWLERRLAASSLASLARHGNDKDIRWFDPGDPTRPSVRLINIDKLAYGAVGRVVDDDEAWQRNMAALLQTTGLRDRAITEPQRSVLQPAFLLEESRTVIRGRGVTTFDEYRQRRNGRRARLSADQAALVWDAVTHPQAPKGFPDLRLAWRNALRAGHSSGQAAPHTHLFVDECQDMTETDFEAFTYLVPDPQRIVVAGDEAQSLKLGSAYHRPRQVTIPQHRQEGATFRLWQQHRLSGSYRLPVRLCEAIQPLAERIRTERGIDPQDDSDAELPVSTKASVLGRRPIVVAASNAATTLPHVWTELGPHLENVPLADRLMTEAEGTFTWPVPTGWERERGQMRDIKGLERDLVVWTTSVSIPAGEPLLSWIYTILTRSRALLVIVAVPDRTDPAVTEALRLLRRDRLLPWDEAADEAWSRLVGGP